MSTIPGDKKNILIKKNSPKRIRPKFFYKKIFLNLENLIDLNKKRNERIPEDILQKA